MKRKHQFVEPVYSVIPKINNIVDNLMMVHGFRNVLPAVSAFAESDASKDLTPEELWHVYKSVKEAVKFLAEENEHAN